MIAVPDLRYRALRLASIWFEPIEILSFTVFLYAAIVFALSTAIKYHSDRLRAESGRIPRNRPAGISVARR